MESDESAVSRIEFIDPLFAISIGIGIESGLVGQGFFKDWRWPVGLEWQAAFSWVVIFTITILSWIGYRQSVRRTKIESYKRFFISIILVLLYGVMFVKHKSVDAVLLMFLIMFLLYLVWDIFKSWEATHRQDSLDRWTFSFNKREWRSCFVTVCWLVAAAMVWGYREIAGFGLHESLYYLAVLIIAIAYRYHKLRSHREQSAAGLPAG
jgi:succinate dehydrogenase hydrophobic anchor subunit